MSVNVYLLAPQFYIVKLRVCIGILFSGGQPLAVVLTSPYVFSILSII